VLNDGVAAVDVTTETFEQDVVQRSREVPVVVDFWADWCGPCRVLGPVLEREAEARDGEVVLAKVDVDANQELAARYGIQGIPAVKAFRDGQVVREFVGALPPTAVAEFLDELTGPSATDRTIEELKASGEVPDVVAALERGGHERALELLLDEIASAQGERRERLVRLTVRLFSDLGDEHPLTMRYRRRLAALLF
jgi:thioredoxin